MVSHESLAGHGHVQAAWLEAIGLVHDDHLGRKRFAIGHCHWYWRMCFAVGLAGRPLAPILLNMRFVLHACAGHWRVDVVLRISTVELVIGKGVGQWYVFVAWPQ